MTYFTPSVSLCSTAPSLRERIYLFSFAVVRECEFIFHTVGRWLAAAEQTNENIIVNGYYQIEFKIIS